MKPITASLKTTIPIVILVFGLIFISFAYFQINHNLEKEVHKTSIIQVKRSIESLQRSINNALSENDWVRAEKELSAITYDISIEELYLIDNHNMILLSNRLSLKNTQYSDKYLKFYFTNPIATPFIEKISHDEILAIYPVFSPLVGGEFRSKVLGVIYLKYNIKNNILQYHSIFQKNIWSLFFILLLIMLCFSLAMHLLVIHPIESLTHAIRQKKLLQTKDIIKPISFDLNGYGEIAILTNEYNENEDLIYQQFKQIKGKESLLKKAQEITHIGICTRSIKSTQIICSDELYQILGRDQADLISTNDAYEKCVYDSDKNSYSTLIRESIGSASSYSIEYRIVRPDQSIRFIREQGDVQESIEANELNLVGVVQDITLQEQAKNFIEISPVVLFRWKAEENWPVDFVTQNISQFGYTRDEFISGQVRFNDIIHPDDREQVGQEVIQYTEENTSQFTQEYRIITHDGDIKWIDDRTTVERDATGKVLYYTGVILDITHAKEIEFESLALGEIISESLNEVYMFDKETLQFTYVNQSAQENIGYTLSELELMTPIDIKPELTAEQFLSIINPLENEPRKKIVFETVHRRKDNSDYFVEIHLQLMKIKERQQYVAIISDISKRKESLELLEKSESKYRQLIENLGANYFFYTHDTDGIFTYVSDSLTLMLGYAPEEFLTSFDAYFTDEDMNKNVSSYTHKSILGIQQEPYQISIYHKDGSIRYLEVTELPLFNKYNEVIAVEGIAKDITEHLSIQDELHRQKDILAYQANHDPLTQLPNRLLLNDRLDQAIKKSKRNKNKVALMFIDLDHFKKINDSLGHNIGDIILKETAVRLKLCVRETDTVARFGGDEFTVLLENFSGDKVVTDIAKKINTHMGEAFVVAKQSLFVTTSIGISLYPNDASTADELLKMADTAMYHSKEEGRDTYSIYSDLKK